MSLRGLPICSLKNLENLVQPFGQLSQDIYLCIYRVAITFCEIIRSFFRTNPYKKIRIIRTFKKIRTIYEKKFELTVLLKKIRPFLKKTHQNSIFHSLFFVFMCEGLHFFRRSSHYIAFKSICKKLPSYIYINK